jgi:hypothetical protein
VGPGAGASVARSVRAREASDALAGRLDCEVVHPARHTRRVVRARLLCSDGDCAAILEVIAPIEEIGSLACECGCGLAVLGWPEPVEDGGAAVLELDPLPS